MHPFLNLPERLLEEGDWSLHPPTYDKFSGNWLDKQLSTTTMETAVMGMAINYSYHANI